MAVPWFVPPVRVVTAPVAVAALGTLRSVLPSGLLVLVGLLSLVSVLGVARLPLGSVAVLGLASLLLTSGSLLAVLRPAALPLAMVITAVSPLLAVLVLFTAMLSMLTPVLALVPTLPLASTLPGLVVPVRVFLEPSFPRAVAAPVVGPAPGASPGPVLVGAHVRTHVPAEIAERAAVHPSRGGLSDRPGSLPALELSSVSVHGSDRRDWTALVRSRLDRPRRRRTYAAAGNSFVMRVPVEDVPGNGSA